jgi:UDP-N-acetylmuramoyl-tripeptide--D-alanyl-D-alanine ligase
MSLTIAEIAEIAGGRIQGLDPGLIITGKVEFDSRKVSAGDLFLAFHGENVDGHDYVEAALAAGAVAAITTGPVPAGSVLVTDPIEAITRLAVAHVLRLPSAMTIIGITGSSGKTSTKDLLAQVLSRHGRTVATPQSFNNELGFPYTALLAGPDTEYLILETSARGIGHIQHLTEIVPPRIGAVLNVGSAHLGEFGSVEAIAKAKGELIEALPSASDGGIAVLNADDQLVRSMSARTSARVVTFGEQAGADVRAERVQIGQDGRATFDLVATGESGLPVALQVRGAHQVSNALAAAAIAINCGMPAEQVALALSAAEPRSAWRMEVTDTPDGITVINDAYNANPESMRAALKALATMSTGRRSIAVLGQMAELGDSSAAEHDAVGRLIVRFDISQLLAVGEVARPIAHGAALEGSWNGESEWLPDVAAAVDRLAEFARPGDVVLVKGSRSAGMERVAAALIEQHTVAAEPAL